MRKRGWWFAGLALALLAVCVGAWRWSEHPKFGFLAGARRLYFDVDAQEAATEIYIAEAITSADLAKAIEEELRAKDDWRGMTVDGIRHEPPLQQRSPPEDDGGLPFEQGMRWRKVTGLGEVELFDPDYWKDLLVREPSVPAEATAVIKITYSASTLDRVRAWIGRLVKRRKP